MENTSIVYLDCLWYCGKCLPPECRDVERIEVFIVDIQLYYVNSHKRINTRM